PEDCSLSEDHVKDAVAAMPRKLPQSGEDQITGGKPKVMRFGSDSLVMQKDDSYPYAAVTIKFKGGESARIDDAEGIAGLAAAVLTEAVEGIDNKALSAWLSDRAASVSASSEYLDFSVSFFCPARFSGELFALLGNMLEKPAFAGEDFERVRRDALASLGMLRENAGSYLGYELSPFLYPNHVYGRRLKGTTKSLPSITLGQVKAFWAKQLTMPFTLSAAGVFDEKDAAALAQRLSARTAADAPDVSAPEWNDDKKLALSLPGRDQEYALMLFPTVPVDHPDSPGIELLSECLGGFTGPLFQELREKRSLGYSAFPMNRSSQYSGFLAFGAVTSPAHEQAVFEQYPLIAARLAHDPLPSEQVEAAKRRIAFGHDSARQSLAHRASSAAHYALWGKPLDFPEERLRKMETMSPEDLKALAAKYLVPEKSYTVTVKP
ncbi:MAG: insulinase family protein, partial [Mailhella sp.]|nr:insulinase family protein [Mailhella sp.]